VGDISQARVISTFHRLDRQRPADLEAELNRFAKRRSLALTLPALFSEFEGDALPGIVDELKGAKYIDQIVLILGGADQEQYLFAREFMRQLPQKTEVIWVDSPRIQAVLRMIEENELYVGEDGKGRSVWMAFGYILGLGKADAVALHDCDILTYERNMLARLVYPIMNPLLGYEFSKGYYARVSDRIYGRVTRLFVTPLIRALIKLIGHQPFLAFLDDFRYPLSGEVAMSSDLTRLNRIPSGWGLEVGSLAEVYRNLNPKRICQVDLADNYDHKHQPLSPEDPRKGLLKMCIHIARSIFHTLSSEGVAFSEELFRSLRVTYMRAAQDTIVKFAGDSAINGLEYDRHAEGLAVETFANGLQLGGEEFLHNPTGGAQIPNWSRVADALPDIHERLVEAVTRDEEEL
jgi:glucosyl-3-phosphoglycerate synthase